ncbi:MAG: phosphate ABC transporter permease subunit PstC [Bdellovibrionales bacterium]
MNEVVVDTLKAPVLNSPELVQSRRREIHLADRFFYYGLKGAAWGVVLLLLAMIVVIGHMAWPALTQFGLNFFVNREWNSYTQEFGALALIHGTLMTSFLALLLAVPVGVGVALFLNELAPLWLSRPMAFVVEMLAAIPSIVYGLWGLFVLAPFLREHVQPLFANHLGWLPIFSGPPIGVGLMAAGVVLAIMITPTIAAISREVFRAIPSTHREAALGIGATRWEMIRLAVLKTGTSGIIGAVILGLGRALGETMAVTMVIGNRVEINWSLFASGQTMASILANQYAEADNDLHLSALTAVGMALFLLSLLINGCARFVVWRVERRFGKGAG